MQREVERDIPQGAETEDWSWLRDVEEVDQDEGEELDYGDDEDA